MISSVRGTAVHVDADALVVEVGGGGLHFAVTTQGARTTHLGDTVTLHTTLIVREDALSLFGFAHVSHSPSPSAPGRGPRA